MKTIKYITTICVAACISACNTLDVPPMNIVKDADLFAEKSGINAYMSKLYIDMPFSSTRPDFEGDRYFLPDRINDASGIEVTNYWKYDNIRAACYFIQEFPKYADRFDKVMSDAWLGEAYFIRAFCYFRMVQVHGGVPIVDKVLNYPEQSVEELSIPRSTEDECYSFILKDVDEAARLLPEESTSVNGLERGRANRYAALALKARVALHAAGVAKYGTPLLQAWSNTEAVQKGLVGVPAAKANEYFNIAQTAAKAIVDGGKYSLYGADLTEESAIIKSYRKLFQDKDNKETILGYYRLYPYNGIILDANCLPNQFGGSYQNHKNPMIDFVKLFDDVDGNPINWDERLGNDGNYTSHLFADPAEAFADLEPRFKAVILYPDASYKGEAIEIRKGILPESTGEFDMANVRISTLFTDKYEDMTIQGQSGMGYDNTTSTGFYCVKFCNEDLPRADVSSTVSKSEPVYSEFRYAEILLTLAEVAVELGRPDEAAPYMNAIRRRAGSKKVFATVALDDVRKEWAKEFVWEQKYHNCMYRWRTYHVEYDGYSPEILYPIYVWDKKAYYLRVVNIGDTNSKRFTFDSRFYYLPIEGISSNKNLIQNPGY